VLTAIAQAATCDRYRPPLDYDVAPVEFSSQVLQALKQPRTAIRMLDLRTTQLLAEGQGSAAAALVDQAFVLSAQLDEIPLQVSYLVALVAKRTSASMCERVLRSGVLIEPTRYKDWDTNLAIADRMDGFAASQASERAYSIATLTEPQMWILRRRYGASILGAYERELQRGERPTASSASSPQLGEEIEIEVGSNNALLELLHDSFQSVRQAMDETRVDIRRARIINALRRAGRPIDDWPDAEPSSLGLSAESVQDPTTGARLTLDAATEPESARDED
jgi:hypothetical protein